MAGNQLSFLSLSDENRYKSLFDQNSQDSGKHFLTAEKAREVLSRSQLDNDVLAHIWDLSHVTSAPQLTFPEFAVAMYLTSMKMTGKDIPPSLPPNILQEIKDAVSRAQSAAMFSSTNPSTSQLVMYEQQRQNNMHEHPLNPMGTYQQQSTYQPGPYQPSLSGHQAPMSTGSTTMSNTLSQRTMATGSTSSMSGSNLMQVPAPTGMLGNSTAFAFSMMPNKSNQQFHPLTDNVNIPWAVTKEEKKEYTKVFKNWDTENTGSIPRDKAKEILSQSGLPQNVLAQIWNLSDINNHGKLNLDEFAVAMHLLYRKLNGYDVPSTLPTELVPPSTRNLKDLETAAKNSLLQGIARKKNLEQFDAMSALSPPRAASFSSFPTARSHSNSPVSKRYETTSDSDDDDVGYVSSARYLGTSRAHSVSTSPTMAQTSYGYRSKTTRISDLKKEIKEHVDRITTLEAEKKPGLPLSALSRQEQDDIKDLKNNVFQLHNHLSHTDDKNGQSPWRRYEEGTEMLSILANTEKSLISEIENMMDNMDNVMLRIKETNEDLKKSIGAVDKQATSWQTTDTSEPPLDVVGTGPNGEITKADVIKAKAKALVAARMNKNKANSASSSPDVSAKEQARKIELNDGPKLEDESKQLQEQRQLLESIKLETRMNGLDIHNKEHLRDVEERLRFEEGDGVAPDLRRFIEELAVTTQVARAPDPDPTFESRFPSFE